MLKSVLIVAAFFVVCFKMGQWLLVDLWRQTPREPRLPKTYYDAEYEEYKSFLESMKKDLENEDINLH